METLEKDSSFLEFYVESRPAELTAEGETAKRMQSMTQHAKPLKEEEVPEAKRNDTDPSPTRSQVPAAIFV